jgi:hypothetical protein
MSNADTLRVNPAERAARTSQRVSIISADALPLPLKLRFATAMRSPAPFLTSLVAISVVVRGTVAWHHAAPRFFPDEYIYASLGRSIGHLGFDIRGGVPHFPAILEPVLAAPLWAAFSTTTAYHLVQLENAVAMSLAALPAYAIARRLSLSRNWSLACALFAVAMPSFTLVAYVMADPIAYPLALGAVAAAVDAVDRPSRRGQILFMLLATLASLGRIQYVVLFVAYAAAATAVSRRRVLRDHRIIAVTLAVGALAVVGSGPQRILGYYSGILDLHVGGPAATWFATHAFILTLAAGVAIVPGAVAALVSPRGRSQTAFAVFTSVFAALLLVEASLYAANGEGRFKERYVFVLLPLLAIAFAVYVQNAKPKRLVVGAVGIAVVIAVARLPLSEYATATAKTDSQFLFAVGLGQDQLGIANMSLIVAVTATVLAGTAVAAAFRGRPAALFALALTVALGASTASAYVDVTVTNAVRNESPAHLTWVDDRTTGSVTALATPYSSSSGLISTMFWNQSVTREVVLPGAFPTDAFAAPPGTVRADGTLPSVRGNVLVNGFGTTAVLAHATRLSTEAPFTLWHSPGVVTFRELFVGRFDDDWLNKSGSLRAWPSAPGRAAQLGFRLSVPRGWSKRVIRLKLGGTTVSVSSGSHVDVTCRSAAGQLAVPFSSQDVVFDSQFRRLTARMTAIRLQDVPAHSGRRVGCAITS